MTHRVLTGIVLSAVLAGCHPRQPGHAPDGAPDVATSTAPATVGFASPEKGIRLSYPADWKPGAAPDPGLILWLVPSGARDGHKAPAVSLEVPKLPPHIPGLIPLGSVVGGYIDDLKKQHPAVKVDDPVNVKVAGANASRVSATWDENGAPRAEQAVLTVHGDRVYIFRANGTAEEVGRVLPVLDRVIESVEWK